MVNTALKMIIKCPLFALTQYCHILDTIFFNYPQSTNNSFYCTTYTLIGYTGIFKSKKGSTPLLYIHKYIHRNMLYHGSTLSYLYVHVTYL